MNRIQIARVALVVLCAYCVSVGFLAAVLPHTFYDDFPFIGHYVDRLPPYNEHLVTDVGGLYLGFAVITGLAAWRPQRMLVLAACAGFLTVSVPHLIFHITHLGGFPVGDAIGEIGGLALTLVPSVVALWAVWPWGDEGAGELP
ncbi:MAG TPA: hypothetical protein VMT37_07080 [Solirubrobacterales bacterium]|nr:hypothetical protein [Solirubrobacterales bacterium]